MIWVMALAALLRSVELAPSIFLVVNKRLDLNVLALAVPFAFGVAAGFPLMKAYGLEGAVWAFAITMGARFLLLCSGMARHLGVLRG